MLALLAPDPGLISFTGEEFSFWYEHVLVGVVSPIAIIASGRYRHLLKLSWAGILYVRLGRAIGVLSSTTDYSSLLWLC